MGGVGGMGGMITFLGLAHIVVYRLAGGGSDWLGWATCTSCML